MQLIVFLVLAGVVRAQVAPTWLESQNAETRDITIVNNNVYEYGTYTMPNDYIKTLANPQVCLAITKIHLVSDDNTLGFRATINFNRGVTGFTLLLEVYEPTTIWHLNVRCFVYDGNYAHLQGTNGYIQVGFLNETITGNQPTTNDPYTIDTASSSYRTDTLVANLGTPINTANTIEISSYLLGFRGTSDNFYGLNISTEVRDANSINVMVTVHPQTQVETLTIYLLVVDTTGLGVSSYTFTQHAMGYSYYGVQKTFFTPVDNSFYDQGYLAGLNSFTIKNNVNYHMTLNNITFTTSDDTSSKYNDVTFFSLYVRYCPDPNGFYNQVDGLCYARCPNGTYLIQNNQTCMACDYSCFNCSDATSCISCPLNRVMSSATSLCICEDYFYEENQICIKCHYSCKTCQASGQYFNCDSCDPIMLRTLAAASNTTCPCDAGYQDVGVLRCQDICGDGDLKDDQCDDSNTVSNDGCSSTCTIEPYFTCTPTPPASGPSLCYYDGELVITLRRIEKTPGQNQATFFYDLSPWVELMSLLDLVNVETNLSTSLFSINKVYMNDLNQFVVVGDYTATIEDLYIRFTIKPAGSNAFSTFQPANTTYLATSNNGMPLVYYTDDEYQKSQTFGVAAFIIGLIFLIFSFVFCLFDWKELGTELFMTTQFSFYSLMALDYFTPAVYDFSKVKHIMGYNSVMGQSIPPELKVPQMEHQGYSIPFQYNFNLMVIMPVLSLIMYGVYRVLKKVYERKQLKGMTTTMGFEETKRGKIFTTFFLFDLFCYWMFFNMQQILIAICLQFEQIQNYGIIVFLILCTAGIVVAVLAVVIRPKSLCAYRRLLFHRSYGDRTFLLVLGTMLVMNILLLMSIKVSKGVFYVLPVFPLVVIIYTAIRRPFKLIWNNIRLIIVELCLLTCLILVIVMMQKQSDIETRDTSVYPIAILGLMCLALIVTIATWVIMLVIRIRNKANEDKYSEDQTKKSSTSSVSSVSSVSDEEESVNERVREAGLRLQEKTAVSSRKPVDLEMTSRIRGKNPTQTNKSKMNQGSKVNRSKVAGKGSNIKETEKSVLEKERGKMMAKKNNLRPLDLENLLKKNQSSARDKKSSHREMAEETPRRLEDDYSSNGSMSNRNRLLDPKDILSSKDLGRNKSPRPRSNAYQQILKSSMTRYK